MYLDSIGPRVQETYLVAANAVPTGKANSAAPNPLAGFEGPLPGGKKEME